MTAYEYVAQRLMQMALAGVRPTDLLQGNYTEPGVAKDVTIWSPLGVWWLLRFYNNDGSTAAWGAKFFPMSEVWAL